MEEKILKNYGMEALSSSELMMVRGGISLSGLKKMLEIALAIVDAVNEYWEDFAKGWNKGWDMI